MVIIIAGIFIIIAIGYAGHTLFTKGSKANQPFTALQKSARRLALAGAIIVLAIMMGITFFTIKMLMQEVPADGSGTAIGFALAFLLPLLVGGFFTGFLVVFYCIPAVFIRATEITYSLFIVCSIFNIWGVQFGRATVFINNNYGVLHTFLSYTFYLGPAFLLIAGVIGFIDRYKQRQ